MLHPDTVFLVMHGSSVSPHSVPVLSTFNRAVADREVEKLRARALERNKMAVALDQHLVDWESNNPWPRDDGETDDSLLGEKRYEWYDLRFSVEKQFTNTFSEQIRQDMSGMDLDSSFHVENISFLEA